MVPLTIFISQIILSSALHVTPPPYLVGWHAMRHEMKADSGEAGKEIFFMIKRSIAQPHLYFHFAKTSRRNAFLIVP